jgi:formylglycine-generating enzyme required for sulfatase activity
VTVGEAKPAVFISYSRKDSAWKDRLATHLAVLASQSHLVVWTDDQIAVGDDWYARLQAAIANASAAILLISANSLTSEFILREEVSRLLVRHHKDGLPILPVVVSPCLWSSIPWLMRMQIMPRNPQRPLSARRRWEVDAAFTEVTSQVLTALRLRTTRLHGVDAALPARTSENIRAVRRPREGLHEHGGSQMPLVYVWGGRLTISRSEQAIVEISPFWMSKYPVTNRQYAEFLRANPEHRVPAFWHKEEWNDPDQPVVGVSWRDAHDFCDWLGVSLPSEAQWEAAATGPEGRLFPWGDEPATLVHANFGQLVGHPTRVGTFKLAAGPYGTFDQAGNVQEWCLDVYQPDAARRWSESGRDPVISAGQDTAMRVLRGGSWATAGEELTNSARRWDWAGNRYDDVGFRCVLVTNTPEPE